VGQGQGFASAREQGAPRVGEPHPRRFAQEQRSPDLGLQVADLDRQRWLRHVQALGGLADAAGFCHGDEVTQALEVHNPYDPDMGEL